MQKMKAFKVVCPECKGAAYTVEPEIDVLCPYCGFDFKWNSQGRELIKEVCFDYEKGGSRIHRNSNDNCKIA